MSLVSPPTSASAVGAGLCDTEDAECAADGEQGGPARKEDKAEHVVDRRWS
jgi:hypothetical protein